MKYVADFSRDTDDAIARAKDDILDKRFSFVDTYRVPQDFNPDDMSTGVDSTVDSIKAGSIQISSPGEVELLKRTGSKTTEGRDILINQFGDLEMESFPRWVENGPEWRGRR